MEGVAEQELCQVAFIQCGATGLNLPFIGTHANCVVVRSHITSRSRSQRTQWERCPPALRRMRLNGARICGLPPLPACARALLPAVERDPVHDSRLYCSHRMESVSLHVRGITSCTS